ncbi:MAG: hypothetical protein PHP57_00265 [Sideroxydans sp.]|nr:hypothetical protein [Sideroxydans sp.]
MFDSLAEGFIGVWGMFDALSHWLTSSQYPAAWAYFVGVQLLLSGVLAGVAMIFLPLKFREPRFPIFVLLWGFAFFIPILGVLLLVLTVHVAQHFQRIKSHFPFIAVELPEFDLVLREPGVKFGTGGIKACLDNSAMPDRRRLQALLTMQSVTARTSNPVLQNLLNDRGEDIRLVAYGLLDGREKRLNQAIQDETARLNSVQEPALKLICLRHLAELEWESVYTGLSQGDLRKRALNQVLAYLNRALEIDEVQAGLWFLKARVLLEMQHWEEAQHSLEQAHKFGLSENRLSPYYAEIAFASGNFKVVRILLSRMAGGQVSARMEPLMQYWLPKNDCAKVVV